MFNRRNHADKPATTGRPGCRYIDVSELELADGQEVTLSQLTERLGLPEHEQQAVLTWTGEAFGRTWTEAEADQFADAWRADGERIAGERG